MNRRPNRSAVLGESPRSQQMREAFEGRARQRLRLPPSDWPEPPGPTGSTRRGDGAVRELCRYLN